MLSRKYIDSIRVHLFSSQLCWFSGAYHLCTDSFRSCMTNLRPWVSYKVTRFVGSIFLYGPNSPENSPFPENLQINRETFMSWKTRKKTTKRMKVPKKLRTKLYKNNKWKEAKSSWQFLWPPTIRNEKGHESNHIILVSLAKKHQKFSALPFKPFFKSAPSPCDCPVTPFPSLQSVRCQWDSLTTHATSPLHIHTTSRCRFATWKHQTKFRTNRTQNLWMTWSMWWMKILIGKYTIHVRKPYKPTIHVGKIYQSHGWLLEKESNSLPFPLFFSGQAVFFRSFPTKTRQKIPSSFQLQMPCLKTVLQSTKNDVLVLPMLLEMYYLDP